MTTLFSQTLGGAITISIMDAPICTVTSAMKRELNAATSKKKFLVEAFSEKSAVLHAPFIPTLSSALLEKVTSASTDMETVEMPTSPVRILVATKYGLTWKDTTKAAA
jgi:hypothetical protein